MIKSLYLSERTGGILREVDTIKVVSGAGIVGDRNFNKHKWPGQNITFITHESIIVFNRDNARSITNAATRRNVVTEGVDLNQLVGKYFLIGGVRFKGVEKCQPCKDLGDALMDENMTSVEVVKAWLDNGGLRADVCSNGEIAIGMTLVNEE